MSITETGTTRLSSRRVAAIYDIHGNLSALEAVLNDLSKEEIDTILFGGDLVWGPEPAPVMECLQSLRGEIIYIRGNADREVASAVTDGLSPEVAEITLWCHQQLSKAQHDFLQSLPFQHSMEIQGLGETLFVHGSPRSDEECIRTNTPAEEIIPMLEGVRQQVLVCGHTHVQFDRKVNGKRIINPGSVGLQSKAKGACWAVIGEQVELRETLYDVNRAVERIKRSGVPHADSFAAHLQQPPSTGP